MDTAPRTRTDPAVPRPVAASLADVAPDRPAGGPGALGSPRPTSRAWGLILFGLIAAFGLGFAWLAVQRHATYRTNAEDLAFTDQALWNFPRGQAFRFSLYEQAEFTTDIDLAALARPDSFLAFHVEPLLALLAPLYLVWSDVRLMLALQALGWALGALPTYRLASRRLASRPAGLAFAAAYLLAPLGQWAVLSDLHTVLFAAPLLLWMADLAECDRPWLFLLAGALAAAAKEEVGLAVAGLGLLALRRPATRRAGLAALLGGAAWSAVCVTLIIPRYAGTAVSPFTARYAEVGGSPGQILLNLVRAPELFGPVLQRETVRGYLGTLLLCGGWLGLFAPELLLPAAPSLALNLLSNSPWMASGRAHYSAVVLPFVLLAAIGGGRRLAALARPVGRPVGPALAGLVLATAALAYRADGAGPLADGFAAPAGTAHDASADRLLGLIPPDARVSAGSSLAPHLSQRTDLYLFPTLRQADYVALDAAATPFPISAGDMALRARELLASGEWRTLFAEDGLLLLHREPSPVEPLPDGFLTFVRPASPRPAEGPALATYLDGGLELVAAELPPPGELGPDGPLGTLRTTWRATRPLVERPRPRLVVRFDDGTEQELSDFAPLWWHPPERWLPGEAAELRATGLPLRRLVDWRGSVPPGGGLLSRLVLPGGPAGGRAATDPDLAEFPLGELTAQVRRSAWRLTVLDPTGQPLWREAATEPGAGPGPLGFKTADGAWHQLGALRGAEPTANGVRLAVATDDPAHPNARVDLLTLGPRSFRLRLTLPDGPPDTVGAIGQAVESPADEKLLGFGQRFTAVDQRGRVVTTWAEDRRVAGYGDSAYAPVPFFISSRGYSLALETDVRSVFDLAAGRPDRYSWTAPTDRLSLVFSYGPEPAALVSLQVARTGLPPLPPIWAFGVWKTAIGGQQQVLEDAERLRTLGIPVSALYVYDAVDDQANLGWPYSTFDGRPAGPYDDLRALTDRLHAAGLRALNYNTADFHADRPSYDEPARRGFFVRDPDGRPYVHPGFQLSWLDFSNPDAVDWWAGLWHRTLVDLGFDGGMLDLGELTPADARYANGLDGREMHNRYPLLYAQAAFEAARRSKPDAVLFVRSGAAGAQAYQHLQWPGDPLIDWSPTDGYPSLLPAALNAGLSGFPFWHPEVGGYLAAGLSPERERELWLRWLQLGALSSTLRDNYGDHQSGQPPIHLWTDDETIAAYRRYARLHNSLVPYLYSYARQAAETGLPLIRHLALSFPDDRRAWREEGEYSLGRELLVAPVLEEGARARVVYLPAGQWVDFWNGALLDGGRELEVAAPLDQIPLFARAGAVLPLATDFETLVPAADPAVRSWDGGLVLRALPSRGPAVSDFRLYDGTVIAYRTDGATATLRLSGAPATRRLELRLPLAGPPGRVLLDGRPAVDWRYDEASRELVLTVEAADLELSVGP